MCLCKKTYIYHNITYKRVINKEVCSVGAACKLCTYSIGYDRCAFKKPCVIHTALYVYGKPKLSRLYRIHYVPV